MLIRRATTKDADLWLRAVEKLVGAEDRDFRLITRDEAVSALLNPNCYLFLALDGEGPVGLLNAFRVPNVEAGGKMVYFFDIEVASERRREGIGKGLTEALVEACEADGVRYIFAGTSTENLAAQKTFEATEAEVGAETFVEYEWDLED